MIAQTELVTALKTALAQGHGCPDGDCALLGDMSDEEFSKALELLLPVIKVKVLEEVWEDAEYGDIPGSRIKLDGSDLWVHTAHDILGWLKTRLDSAKRLAAEPSAAVSSRRADT